jgi:DNA polymerase-3 subunit delta'
MQFSQITGKSQVKNALVNQVDKQRIPHAQIFLSKEGSGSLAIALAYASYILCKNKSNDDSCGKCNSCIKSYKYIHPDVHFSFPVVKLGDKKRSETTSVDFLPKWREILNTNPFFSINQWLQFIEADNNSPNINVKECNDIVQNLSLMSYESGQKILIMWLPEYLGTEGNRLLKLIEEPTDNTFIILVSENQDHILQTILSRCQLIKIPNFEDHEITDYLNVSLNIENYKAEQISNLSDGNLSLAIAISQNESNDYSENLIDWLRKAYKSDPIEINQWIDGISRTSKDEQKNFFEYGLHFLRQLILLNLTGGSRLNLTPKELEVAEKMRNLIDIEKAEKISNILNEALEFIPRNMNIKILLFADTLNIGQILRATK